MKYSWAFNSCADPGGCDGHATDLLHFAQRRSVAVHARVSSGRDAQTGFVTARQLWGTPAAMLIIGSGSSYHNMRRMGPQAMPDPDVFDAWLQQTPVASDPVARIEQLSTWQRAPAARGASARRASAAADGRCGCRRSRSGNMHLSRNRRIRRRYHFQLSLWRCRQVRVKIARAPPRCRTAVVKTGLLDANQYAA